MGRISASLEVFAGKSADQDDVGRPARVRRFDAESEAYARFKAFAFLRQTARRWRTSDKFTFVELICREEGSDRACLYCLRGRWVFKESILKLPLSFKNAGRIWKARRLIGGKKQG